MIEIKNKNGLMPSDDLTMIRVINIWKTDGKQAVANHVLSRRHIDSTSC